MIRLNLSGRFVREMNRDADETVENTGPLFSTAILRQDFFFIK